MNDSLCDLCGKTMPEDEAYSCRECGRVFCSDCGEAATEICFDCGNEGEMK